MQTVETLFERELAALINKRIDEIKDRVSGGQLEDFFAYKSQCGMIDGLTAALDLMAVAHDAAQQRNR